MKHPVIKAIVRILEPKEEEAGHLPQATATFDLAFCFHR